MARLTQPYKNTGAHRQRTMSTESQFNGGMKYTNQPLGDGYAKTLVNFKLHNDGETLTPRGGLKAITGYKYLTSAATDFPVIYTATSVFVNNFNRTDVSAHKVVILGFADADGIRCSDMTVLVDTGSGFIKCTTNINYSSYHLRMTSAIDSVHGIKCNDDTARSPIATVLNGVLYFLTNTKLSYIDIKFTDSTKTAATYTLPQVYDKTLVPSLTINYGYNMLSDTPYTFSNTETATGALTAHGVIPYDSDGKLLLSARPGTPITFKLVYTYPSQHVSDSEKYRVQWEIQDNDAGTSPEIVQTWSQSEEYDPSDNISITFAPTISNFSLICRMYVSSDIAEQETEWDNNENLQSLCKKEDFVTPECVTTLASYYLTSDSDTTAKNLEPVNYNLATAQGMCTWQQRLVLWGVHGCTTTMWVSEVNDPTYFPYPNNVEVFGEDIIKCVPYLTDLLIFTRTSIYRCQLNEDGLTFKVTRVQDKLNMDYDDASSVIAVQNMVFFRSNNMYYMVVPNYSYNTGTYGVQLAPISRPVEQLFDDFTPKMLAIINSVYGLSPDLKHYPLSQELQWYTIFQDGNEVHNVFCTQVYQRQKTSSANAVLLGTFNFHVVYDSVLRTWTILIEEGDDCAPQVYMNTSTGDTQYVKIVQKGNDKWLYLYKYDDDDIVDTLPVSGLNNRKYSNKQYLDTGNRDFAEDLKKRFREVQFCVNILERGQLKFNTGFVVDDTPEVMPYHWNVEVIDPATGTLGVSREYSETCDTPEHTTLDTWKLDTDTFPDTTMFKIRYHVCGKGYNGSAQILSDNNIKYELRHISFVYRQMFAR